MSISLKPFAEEHIKKTFEWVSDEELQKLFLITPPIIWETHQKHLKKIMGSEDQVIFTMDYNGAHIGNCGFKYLDFENKECELWLYIGEKSFWGKGIGSKVMELLIDYAFNVLEMNTIIVHASEYNLAVLNLNKKYGFEEVEMGKESLEIWGNKDFKIIEMRLQK